MFTKRRPGFTLIEILVVISIIAILTAILLPVFATVRHRARMTACASNLHQISLALHQYAADNDGTYPLDGTLSRGDTKPHLNLVWTLLTPYTRNTEVFHCPEAWGPSETARGYNYINGSWPAFGTLANLPPPKAPRPGSGTVVAYCGTHVKRLGPDAWAMEEYHFIGPLIVVREDGSTSQVQGNLVERWDYHNGQWVPLPFDSRSLPQVGDWVRTRFPGEEWPPQD